MMERAFGSIEEGVHWWVDVTQKNWLRKNFQKEKFMDNQDPIIRVSRWLSDNEEKTERYSLREAGWNSDSSDDSQGKNSIHNFYLQIFKALHLIDPVAWPKDEMTSHVIVTGGLEDMVKDRVMFMPGFSKNRNIDLYYATNPRMLMNWEPSFAPILAAWFYPESEKQAEAVRKIQAVLDDNKDMKTSRKNWLQDPDGLKQDILAALGETAWPVGKSWYDKDPTPYETVAKNEKRPSPAGLPTAMDMVEYLLQQRRRAEPDRFEQITLLPVYSVREGRIANTADNAEDWYNQYGRYIIINSWEKFIFISNNSKGLHGIPAQDAQIRGALKKIGAVTANGHTISDRVLTVGSGAEECRVSFACEALAKVFYMKKADLVTYRIDEMVFLRKLLILDLEKREQDCDLYLATVADCADNYNPVKAGDAFDHYGAYMRSSGYAFLMEHQQWLADLTAKYDVRTPREFDKKCPFIFGMSPVKASTLSAAFFGARALPEQETTDAAPSQRFHLPG